MSENKIGSRKLVLDRETIRELDPESLEQVAGGDVTSGLPGTTIIDTIIKTVGTVVETITIIASSPCSNVYSRCRTCMA